ncbi:MAG: transcription termination/antitermination NusG family protein [Chloroflexota bacterium]|nr:transcription termination/antitermination NusG family protein [Chloroflexota bacterium]
MLEEIADNESHQEWHVVRTAPRSERLAAQELCANGFESFCPRIIIGSHNNSSFYPLFPGYIFARRVSSSANIHPIYMLPHVYGWVSFNGTAPTVPENIIEELKTRVENINSDGGLWHKYEIGDLVRVTVCGVDTVGTVVTSPKTREKPIEILLDFMGRQVPTKVSIDKVNPFQYNFQPIQNMPRRSRGKGRWTQQYRDLKRAEPVLI